jgi:tRNA pseudouridine38-40 synthase
MTRVSLPPSTWRFVVAYRGGGFAGWQVQEGRRTVQGELQRALCAIAGGAPVAVRGAGRTDAGVHARGQVASARFATAVPPHKMVLALGSQLGDDVSVLAAHRVGDDFDARAHAVGKRYVYRVHNAAFVDPMESATSWHVRKPLDVAAMAAAAEHFVGEKDFESFRSAQCDAAHARRYLWRVAITELADIVSPSARPPRGPLLSIEVRGNAFCRNMVRCIAGTLVDVGRGRFRPADVPAMFAARDRRGAGVTAPPEGLTLEEVYYPDAVAHAGIPEAASFPGWPPNAVDVASALPRPA